MRTFLLLAVATLCIVVAGPGCSDDPAAPEGGSCSPLPFTGITPTDEEGTVTGASGDGGWCHPGNGADPSQPYFYPAYPNPFNPLTIVRFSLVEEAQVFVRIYDQDCKLVRTLVDDIQPAGITHVAWNGEDEQGIFQPDGIYACVLTVGEFKCYGNLEIDAVP
ncbi:hypothetical protein KJ682_07525 [bacterium]|nr:hypothetical protein [bacterium]